MINSLTPRKSRPSNATTDFKTLQKLLSESTANAWRIGDLIIRLVDVHSVKLRDIAKRLDQSSSYLSQMASAARAYPPQLRRNELGWNTHHIARNAADTVARSIKEYTRNEVVEPDYQRALDIIATGVTENGVKIRNAREATKALIADARPKFLVKLNDEIRHWLTSSPLVDGCHHSDCRDLLTKFEPSSIRIAHLDPPYAGYRKTADGKYHLVNSSALQDCDCSTELEAVQVTCDIIRALPKYLMRDGVILLWQSAMSCLRLPIVQAIDEAGLECFGVVTWNKGRPQTGNYNHAYTTWTEILYVIGRVGEQPLNFEHESSRSNVLGFKPLTQSTGAMEPYHGFQKPLDLMEHLIEKHSNKGELVADLFGCSGSACVAAAKHRRHWVYCERNADNFDLGLRNIGKYLDKDSLTAD